MPIGVHISKNFQIVSIKNFGGGAAGCSVSLLFLYLAAYFKGSGISWMWENSVLAESDGEGRIAPVAAKQPAFMSKKRSVLRMSFNNTKWKLFL